MNFKNIEQETTNNRNKEHRNLEWHRFSKDKVQRKNK